MINTREYGTTAQVSSTSRALENGLIARRLANTLVLTMNRDCFYPMPREAVITPTETCPRCAYRFGWDGLKCRHCNYPHAAAQPQPTATFGAQTQFATPGPMSCLLPLLVLCAGFVIALKYPLQTFLAIASLLAIGILLIAVPLGLFLFSTWRNVKLTHIYRSQPSPWIDQTVLEHDADDNR